MRIFLVFRHTIYASGFEVTLSAASGVESVNCASSIASALEDEALIECRPRGARWRAWRPLLVVLEVATQSGARILMCLQKVTDDRVLDALSSGAAGTLAAYLLMPDTLIGVVPATSRSPAQTVPDL
jgi:hypothetical protein